MQGSFSEPFVLSSQPTGILLLLTPAGITQIYYIAGGLGEEERQENTEITITSADPLNPDFHHPTRRYI